MTPSPVPVAPAVTGGVPDWVPIAALIISIAAALFTGWQAYTVHRSRVDQRRVELHAVVQNDRTGTPHWTVSNSGGGTAVDLKLFVGRREGWARTFELSHPGALQGHSEGVLIRKEPERHWPGAETTVSAAVDPARGYLWDGRLAEGEWSTPDGKLRKADVRVSIRTV